MNIYYQCSKSHRRDNTVLRYVEKSWWRHQMKTLSTLLALYEGNPPVSGGFPATASDAEIWWFFLAAPEQTVEQTIECSIQIYYREKLRTIWKAQWIRALTFWFFRNGLAPTTTKYCDCNVKVKGTTGQQLFHYYTAQDYSNNCRVITYVAQFTLPCKTFVSYITCIIFNYIWKDQIKGR